MKPLATLSHTKNSADLALAQAEFCSVNMGQVLIKADVAELEQHAHELLASLLAVKAALAAPDHAGSNQDTKPALQQSLVKMSLQLQVQRELLMRKASMVDRQLDTLLPPASRLTYQPSKALSAERRGVSTYLKA
jgi:alkylation response protein AidB-like acyl-CoA dehydrogenase